MISRRSVSPLSLLSESINNISQIINVQIFIPVFNIQRCVQVNLDDTVWFIKQSLLSDLPQELAEGFNYGLFLPPCNGRAGKFLLEDRPFRDYPFQDCVPFLELKYKKRVYKTFNLDKKVFKQLHSKNNLKKFCDYAERKESKKVEEMCQLGLDPNFHNGQGETPLILASGIEDNRDVILALVAGGAHLDFRNLRGETAMHLAVLNSSRTNVKTLLDLGASTQSRDKTGLTPLYYLVSRQKTNPDIAELVLRDYAETGVVDSQGNQEIHQACKNGLSTHLEHLLFYGADADCQNYLGNTPLHVCVYNDQISCAKVLLFRNADVTILNKFGQSAYHVAANMGHMEMVHLIATHDPVNAVPYRSQPRYNSKRRLTWSRAFLTRGARRRSLSLFDQSEYGTTPATSRAPIPWRPIPETNENSSLDNLDVAGRMMDDDGIPEIASPDLLQHMSQAVKFPNTNRRFSQPIQFHHMEIDKQSQRHKEKGNEIRSLIIPRGTDGFGFVLRGAKKLIDEMVFQPTFHTPSLQFFEKIEPGGMASKAGLKAGDFLLEVNDIDVRCWNHDDVVKLIGSCDEIIKLQVITVDNIEKSIYGTLRINNKAPSRQKIDPSRTLSIANGHYYERQLREDNTQRDSEMIANFQEVLLPAAFRDPKNKVASIRNRITSRRISATELEKLMTDHLQNDNKDHHSIGVNNCTLPKPVTSPKVYASVAEMKRLKVTKSKSPTSSVSSTDLEISTINISRPSSMMSSFAMAADSQKITNSNKPGPSGIINRKPIMRPKTPPPPPPVNHRSGQRSTNDKTTIEDKSDGSGSRDYSSTIDRRASSSSPVIYAVPENHVTNFVPTNPHEYILTRTNSNGLSDYPVKENVEHCLDKYANEPDKYANLSPLLTHNDKNVPVINDFASDLRSALARRRHQIMQNKQLELLKIRPEMASNGSNVENLDNNVTINQMRQVRRRSFSSCDGEAPSTSSYSPPSLTSGGPHVKKDSGYTSSRNSLEKSECENAINEFECGESSRETALEIEQAQKLDILNEISINEGHEPKISDDDKLDSGNNESPKEDCTKTTDPCLISKCSKSLSQLTPSTTNEHDSLSQTSDLSLVSAPSAADLSTSTKPQILACDENEKINTVSPYVSLSDKPVACWTVDDVSHWLDSLYLSEYKRNFERASVNGVALMRFGRAEFAQMGVTRIAHRLAIENALKSHKKYLEK